jgi:glutamate N-acetyltransferase/amino-acid N-acetyltransferase
MATMLVYIFTNARISQSELQTCLSELNQTTFNAITVDSDTSTSDTLLLASTRTGPEMDMDTFRTELRAVMQDLAHQVVRDGEGRRNSSRFR